VHASSGLADEVGESGVDPVGDRGRENGEVPEVTQPSEPMVSMGGGAVGVVSRISSALVGIKGGVECHHQAGQQRRVCHRRPTHTLPYGLVKFILILI
jgi:hypothetical protein